MRFLEFPWRRHLRRIYEVIRYDGFSAFSRKAIKVLRKVLFPETYRRWISRYDTLDRGARQSLEADVARLPSRPLISIIMPILGGDAQWLDGTIRSVQLQLYPQWELCLAVGRSLPESLSKNLRALARQDGRIRIADVEDASTWADKANAALKLASGDFVALADPGDALSEQALYWVAKELVAYPDTDLIFSDEDKIGRGATRSDPWFKPDWNPALMLSCNAFGRLGIFRRSMLERLAGFHAGFEGAEEYELVLRCARASEFHRIRHIARILYHRRGNTKDQRTDIGNWEAGRRAIAEHLAIQNVAAEVRRSGDGYQVAYAIPTPHPQVSVIMPSACKLELLVPCLKTLLAHTTYRQFEVLLAVSEFHFSVPEQAAYLAGLKADPRVRVLVYEDQPYNFSRINNWAVRQASGSILCLLNDDIEIITADWLEQLVARVSLPQVAAAGPTLYYPNGTIQHAGVILGLSGIAGHACYGEPRGSHGYFGRASLEQDVSCVTAAAMAIRAEAFRTIGGFDEAIPLAYNDVDLCLRLRAAGWRIIWTPVVELVHHESATLGRHNVGARAEQFARDVTLMRQRWQPILNADPFYNRNLSLERAYALAIPPRLSA